MKKIKIVKFSNLYRPSVIVGMKKSIMTGCARRCIMYWGNEECIHNYKLKNLTESDNFEDVRRRRRETNIKIYKF
jgi:hypothetical protein